MPFRTCRQYEVSPATRELVWASLGEGEVFITRDGGVPFTFATGQQATLKADAERLFAKRAIQERLLGIYGVHPCVVEADALSFVPNGTAGFAKELRHKFQPTKPIVRLYRPDGAPRTDIRYVSPSDRMLAQEMGSVCLVEDISRTGFSAHVTAQILREANPGLDIHTLSMLQRDEVEPRYKEGVDAVVYHTFVRQDLPLEVDEFRQQFPDIPIQTVP